MHKPTSRAARRLLAVAAASIVSISLVMAGPLSQAQSLDDQKTTVQTKIANNKKAQTQAESKLADANQALADAQKKLADAQADLADKQQATAAAQAEDNRLAADLADANTTLAARQADAQAAADAVTAGLAQIADQRDKIGLVVQTSTQQNTALLSLSILFSDFNTEQINNRVQWATTVFAASQDAMDNLLSAQTKLEDAQTLAAQAQQAASDAQAIVAAKKALAADHLSVTKAAQQASQQAQNNVAAQVAASTKAKADAQSALDAANAEDAQLQKDLANIEAQIKKELDAQKASGKPVVNQPAPSTGKFFYRPVPGAITSPYGMRMHPIYHVMKFHAGVDMHASCGTPIHAAADGTVAMAQRYGGYGNFVRLNNGKIAGNNYGTGYAHMSKILVSKGQHVTRGQVIGLVGTTGTSTGCHLHFEVYKNGSTVNPASYI